MSFKAPRNARLTAIRRLRREALRQAGVPASEIRKWNVRSNERIFNEFGIDVDKHIQNKWSLWAQYANDKTTGEPMPSDIEAMAQDFNKQNRDKLGLSALPQPRDEKTGAPPHGGWDKDDTYGYALLNLYLVQGLPLSVAERKFIYDRQERNYLYRDVKKVNRKK